MNGMKGDDEHMYIDGTCCVCAVHHTWGLSKAGCVKVSLNPADYRIARAKYRKRAVLLEFESNDPWATGHE